MSTTNEPIKYYEADPQDQKKVTVTCHDCKVTLDLSISKARIVQYCLCCGKAAVITDNP